MGPPTFGSGALSLSRNSGGDIPGQRTVHEVREQPPSQGRPGSHGGRPAEPGVGVQETASVDADRVRRVSLVNHIVHHQGADQEARRQLISSRHYTSLYWSGICSTTLGRHHGRLDHERLHGRGRGGSGEPGTLICIRSATARHPIGCATRPSREGPPQIEEGLLALRATAAVAPTWASESRESGCSQREPQLRVRPLQDGADRLMGQPDSLPDLVHVLALPEATVDDLPVALRERLHRPG